MDIPEGLDLTLPLLMFLGTGATFIFLASWKLFNVRNADHEKFAQDLSLVKSELEKIINKNHQQHEDRISRNREDMTSKIEGKCEAIKVDIERNEKNTSDQYKEIHGRLNKGNDELCIVRANLSEAGGELKVISQIVLKDL